MEKTLFIINPTSKGGTGGNVWEKFKALCPTPIHPEQVIFTERPGHARTLATTTEGYAVMAVVGGDGTVGEVISGLMDRQDPRPAIAIIPGGTGNDIAKNLGIFSIEDSVQALTHGRSCPTDVIQVDCLTEGKPARQHAILFGAVGFCASPMIQPWMKRVLGPVGAYYLGSLLQVIAYKPPRMTACWDQDEQRGLIWSIVIGNAEKAAGGSMCLAPGALTDDGELNISIIPAKPKWDMVTQILPKISTGAHTGLPDVSYFPEKRIEITSEPPALIDLDGDVHGTTPATFTVCPQAVEILTP
jgi:diacylglycerol kinase (ATP)